ncbi:short-chain dehydrogenase reductase sdr [Fusarium albosuccineum]|uniref:Short-chain dehydrogenase reductase sdr n=1 Tax=Fusarium albosuccineum TaxID=1237068 RepID=A0A8H4L3Y0_9HYPO|nr:short-chain dehydrogenase reductase sdr [Fusarium albosuccineum]
MESAHHLTLASQVAIVTGAARGIGAAIALDLARKGANVAITYISESSEEAAAKVVSDIKSLGNGSSAIMVRADSGSADGPRMVVEATRSAFGGHIDILVNNAAIVCIKPLTEVTNEDFENSMNANVRGPLLFTKAVLPHLRKGGRIINISSVVARQGHPASSIYLASKAGLEGLTRALAAELGPAGHTVNAVEPGTTETDAVRASRNDPNFDQIVVKQIAATPLGRIGNPQDVAMAAVTLAEPQARWITGQTISVSGGLAMI